jgi:hypothetical protein
MPGTATAKPRSSVGGLNPFDDPSRAAQLQIRGADDGNRTRVFSLGSRSGLYSTVCSGPLRSVRSDAKTCLNCDGMMSLATAVFRCPAPYR